MGLKFEPKKFKFGMRTLKTGIAVFLVLGLFSAFGWDGLQIGCLTAVFSLRENFDRSVQFGKSRIFAKTVGGILSLLFYFVNMWLDTSVWVTLLLIPILTMLTIVINVSFNNASGVIGGVAALLVITLSIPPDNTFTYVIARVFETFCGVFIAILVNYDYDWLLKHLK